VTTSFRTRVRELARPVALGLGRLGLTPNALTLIGFAIAVVAAVAAGAQAWQAAGILVLVGGVFDLFDGALARATNTASPLGAFMDSVFDRGGEAIVYLGIIVGALAVDFDEAVLAAAAAMAAAFMVSYTRSKSEGLGFTAGTGMAAVGLAPREIRIVILAAGLVLAGPGTIHLVPAPGATCIESCIEPGGMILLGALALIAILATITTIQRIVHVIRRSADQKQG
jgi:phosphatidylglycerophosphate synthase